MLITLIKFCGLFNFFKVRRLCLRKIMIAPAIPKTWNEIVELILRAACVVSSYYYVAS